MAAPTPVRENYFKDLEVEFADLLGCPSDADYLAVDQALHHQLTPTTSSSCVMVNPVTLTPNMDTAILPNVVNLQPTEPLPTGAHPATPEVICLTPTKIPGATAPKTEDVRVTRDKTRKREILRKRELNLKKKKFTCTMNLKKIKCVLAHILKEEVKLDLALVQTKLDYMRTLDGMTQTQLSQFEQLLDYPRAPLPGQKSDYLNSF